MLQVDISSCVCITLKIGENALLVELEKHVENQILGQTPKLPF